MASLQNPAIAWQRARIRSRILVGLGVVCAFLAGYGWAGMTPPTEHKGLEVEVLGFVPGESMAAQVGLEDRKLLLRRITIQPVGQIAKHSAESTPAAVYMMSGTWTEGHAGGETTHSAGETFIEDADSVHWFFNRGEEPATALVCDIKPAG